MKNRIKNPPPSISDGTSKQTIQDLFHEMLSLSFMQGVELMNAKARLNYANLVREFEYAYEPYGYTKVSVEILEATGHELIPRDNRLDRGWYRLTRKHFFENLDPSTQAELRRQGLQL